MTYIVWSGKLLVSLWPSCVADADSVFLPCGFFLSIFFPRLISAESRMHVWNVLHAARWNTGCKTTTQQPFYGPLSGTTRVSQYQKKHSPTHHPDHHPVFISCFHLPRSIASSLFKLHAWQSFCTTSFYVLFGLPLGLEPSTSYSVHFFTKWVFFFAAFAHTIATCFAVVSILYYLFLVNSLLGTLSFTLTLHIHLTILISARWSATSFLDRIAVLRT